MLVTFLIVTLFRSILVYILKKLFNCLKTKNIKEISISCNCIYLKPTRINNRNFN